MGEKLMNIFVFPILVATILAISPFLPSVGEESEKREVYMIELEANLVNDIGQFRVTVGNIRVRNRSKIEGEPPPGLSAILVIIDSDSKKEQRFTVNRGAIVEVEGAVLRVVEVSEDPPVVWVEVEER